MDSKKRKRVYGSQEKTGKEEAEWQFTSFPSRVLKEIFLRLPIKALGKCRCVCKTWFLIISDPQFAKFHLSVSPICILIKNKPPKRESRRLYLSHVVEDTYGFQFESINFTSQYDLPDTRYELVNSCNGLICLYGFQEEKIYVCNPVLGSDLKAEIYTLGTGSWRSIGNALDEINVLCFNPFLHATLHWANYNEHPVIYCFDFEKELFGEIPAPPDFKQDKYLFEMDFYNLKLGVFEGCLSACCYDATGTWEFEIWVMKDYGVKESWTTLFHIDVYRMNINVTDDHFDYYYPLIFLKNGEILISFNDQILVCYNLEIERLRDTRISRTKGKFAAVGYTPCFVSLEDVAKGEKISRKRRSGNYDNTCFRQAIPESWDDNISANDSMEENVACF